MPSALIEVRHRYSVQEEVAITDAVHDALVAAFRIPAQDKDVRLVAHEPHRFACSPRLAEPEFFTLVSINCFTGRSVQAKRALYSGIVDRLTALGIPRDRVTMSCERVLPRTGVSAEARQLVTSILGSMCKCERATFAGNVAGCRSSASATIRICRGASAFHQGAGHLP